MNYMVKMKEDYSHSVDYKKGPSQLGKKYKIRKIWDVNIYLTIEI